MTGALGLCANVQRWYSGGTFRHPTRRRAMTEATQITIPEGHVVTFEKTLSDTDVRAFAEASGDRNPLHLDDAYAARTRFGKRIAHGMLTAGVISAALGTKLAPPGTLAVYLGQTLQFRRP